MRWGVDGALGSVRTARAELAMACSRRLPVEAAHGRRSGVSAPDVVPGQLSAAQIVTRRTVAPAGGLVSVAQRATRWYGRATSRTPRSPEVRRSSYRCFSRSRRRTRPGSMCARDESACGARVRRNRRLEDRIDPDGKPKVGAVVPCARAAVRARSRPIDDLIALDQAKGNTVAHGRRQTR